ncbi:MAG: DUF456 domain-containing protein [Hyphomicrobiales bacterium]
MSIDWLWILIGIILSLGGIIGAIIPALPGPALSFLSLLILNLTHSYKFSTKFLVIFGIIAALVTVIDYIVPAIGTKKFGGTSAGSKGSTVGLILAVFVFPIFGLALGPFGLISIILGPFVGAYVGENLAGNKEIAMKSAIGSFIGFLAGTFMKLVFSIIAVVYFILQFF